MTPDDLAHTSTTWSFRHDYVNGTGAGTGRYNGDASARAEWVLTDAGEGGSGDTATITIWDAGDNIVLQVSAYLRFGNHQAHSN